MKLNNEIWKDIEGYEGLYQVSNYGRIKSLAREIEYVARNQYTEYIRKQKVEERIMKTGFDKDGYVQVGLSLNGKVKTKRVHFLVAKAFIPNPNNYNCLNHINEVKTDNRVENLEWCSIAYNNAYGSRSKAVNQYDLDGNFIKQWKNAVEATKALGLKKSGNITSCCKNRPHINTVGGYVWRYTDE